MRQAIVAGIIGVVLAGCAVRPQPVPSGFPLYFAQAEQARAAQDYSAALALYAAARDTATTQSDRWSAAFGQFQLARAVGDAALARQAAQAALATGVASDPTLLEMLRHWADAGALVVDVGADGGVNTGATPDPSPSPVPTPPLDSGVEESIQPNPDGSVPMRALEAQRAALAPGVALFRVPPTMTQGKPADVLYRVSASRVGTFQIVPGGSAAPAEGAHVYSIRIGRCMSADLIGAGFTITPAQEALQKTGADRRAEWRWTVVPSESGPRVLTLRSRILAYVAGRCDEQLELLPTQERAVDVKVAAPPASTPTPRPGDTPARPDPAPDPRPGGIGGWLALGAAALAAITAFLANLNKLVDEWGKLRARLFGKKAGAGG